MEKYESGSVRLINMDSYIKWYEGLSMEDALAVRRRLMASLESKPGYRTPESSEIDKMFEAFQPLFVASRDKTITKIRQFVSYANSINAPFRIGRWIPGVFAFLYLGNPEVGFVLVDQEKYLLEYIPEKDFSGMTPAQILARSSIDRDSMSMSIAPRNFDGLTLNDVRASLDGKKAEADNLVQKMDDVKKAKEESLAKLQAEIEAKQAELRTKQEELMRNLKEQQRSMEEQINRMEDQLFLLESQIYAIRCYSGEVVTFTQISSGRKAPDTEPIIIHQKLRFLDEDLGRLTSLYEISWSNLNLFEDFLRYSPVALETFAPNERCVVLVRLSRNGTTFQESSQFPYSNILEGYNRFHGKTVGIIIRNGENLYLGWTEEEKVHIKDDLIVTQVFTETVPVQTEDPDRPLTCLEERALEEKIKKERQERRELMDGIVSRVFIYNILQGIVDSTDWIPLPAGVKMNTQSEYVIYSVADLWLSDTRFGSFTEIIEKCNAKVTRGDVLLTVQRLVPERAFGYAPVYSHAWNNVRGIGDANRTHDCVVYDCTLYPANLVLNDDAKGNRHIYVSVEKQDTGWVTGTKARANFELHPNEFINLTYMNSVWLEWVINNKTLGDWKVGGTQVDYAYAIRYLKTAMDYIRKREEDEKKCLDAIDPRICEDPNWPLKLTQWKLETNVRAINLYQAARFVKSLQ